MAFKDETGNRYGRLEVLSYEGMTERSHTMWLCRCDCGGEKVVLATSLRSGYTASCGCLQSESRKTSRLKHGLTETVTYKTWRSMKERCLNENSTQYHKYGARGITVSQLWIDSFESFLEDMGEQPEGSTLDRIDPYCGYYPENCRWTDSSNQAFNKTKSVKNTSGRTGVVFNKKTNKWIARITKNYEHIHLGSFSTKDEAIEVRKAAELEYYGYSLKGQDG